MSQLRSWRVRRTAFMNRAHARLAARARPATGFVSQPEPQSVGHFARGRQLLAGNFLFAGVLTEAPGGSVWDSQGDSDMVARELHSFAWLDDLAAVGDARARQAAQAWLAEWIEEFGHGIGPGWTPDLTGRRLIRWISHGFFLLRGQDAAPQALFFRSLAQQTTFLGRRWRSARPGVARFEATCGLIYAGLSLEGLEHLTGPAIKALAEDCASQIDAEGGIATRNPEELLEVLTLLNWAAQAIISAGQTVPDNISAAIARITPTLRALRHSDGGLARFHGGGRGLDGRLDHALSLAGKRTQPGEGLRMGYARISAGRTSIVMDGAPPPLRDASGDGHASTLGFEVTSGRRPLIVNCGSGASFGAGWRRAGRATPSHSTLGIDGHSSSRLGPEIEGSTNETLVDQPRVVHCIVSDGNGGRRAELSHDGYRITHGLTHARILEVGIDGRGIVGEDLLTTLDTADKARFDAARMMEPHEAIPFSVRFHLHPDVDATVDLNGAAVSMALKSGEIWVFRHDSSAELSLAPSVYLEKGRLRPRAAQQVVLTGTAIAYATRVRWSLAKAQDTPDVVRDLAPAHSMDEDEQNFGDET